MSVWGGLIDAARSSLCCASSYVLLKWCVVKVVFASATAFDKLRCALKASKLGMYENHCELCSMVCLSSFDAPIVFYSIGVPFASSLGWHRVVMLVLTVNEELFLSPRK